MIMQKAGSWRADDRWRIEWDLRGMPPHRIDAFNDVGNRQWRWSGRLTMRDLNREFKRFAEEHGLVQLSF